VYDDELKDYAGTSATELDALNKSAKETVTSYTLAVCGICTAAEPFPLLSLFTRQLCVSLTLMGTGWSVEILQVVSLEAG